MERLIMKRTKRIILIGLISAMSLIMTACSDDKKEASTKTEVKNDHVWKTQTDALQTAKDSAKEMQETLKKQQEQFEKSN